MNGASILRRPIGGLSLLASVLLLAGAAYASDEPAAAPAMETEIDFLVDAVGASPCKFIRNDKEHDAADASKHLQMKRKRGKRYFDTTEQFIDRIASKSSWTGRNYLIRCGKGASATTVTANEWFTEKLAEFRAGENSPGEN